MTNKMHLFLARNCRKVAEQKLDETEELTVERVPLSKAVDMVMTNEICCNSSAHGILRTAWMMETWRFAETNEKCCKIDSDLL